MAGDVVLSIGETWQATKKIQRDTTREGVEAEARKATRRKLSLSVSFARFEEHATRKKSDAAAAACDVYTRIARIHFSPFPLPSFFFFLLLLLLFLFSLPVSSSLGSPLVWFWLAGSPRSLAHGVVFTRV